jgi:hypothetical protein
MDCGEDPSYRVMCRNNHLLMVNGRYVTLQAIVEVTR